VSRDRVSPRLAAGSLTRRDRRWIYGWRVLARIVAVLAGLALVCCCWWMVDQNGGEPDGEVSLSLVVLANGSSVPVVIYEGGDEGGGNGGVPSIEDAQRVVAAIGGTPCAGLPAIGHLLKPAPHWVEVVRADGTSACLLSGRWRMAELADGVDDTLSVSDVGGRLQVEYKSRAGNQDTLDILDFDLTVRFPAGVESVEGGAASVSGSTVRWTGAESLRSGPELAASGRVVSLPRELAPWLVGSLALLMVGVGILWPRSEVVPVASDAGSDRAELGARMRPAAPKTLAPPKPPAGPDPDSPWRPPS